MNDDLTTVVLILHRRIIFTSYFRILTQINVGLVAKSDEVTC